MHTYHSSSTLHADEENGTLVDQLYGLHVYGRRTSYSSDHLLPYVGVGSRPPTLKCASGLGKAKPNLILPLPLALRKLIHAP